MGAYENLISVPSSATAGQVPIANGNGGYSWGTPASFNTVSVSIAVADWSSNSATKNATGVTADNALIIAPAPASYDEVSSCGVYCSAQNAGTLTFTYSDAKPSSAITMNVLILG